MEKRNHIEISLEWQGKQVDLAVPSQVSAKRLVNILSQAFKANHEALPEVWHFVVKGRNVDFESGLTLKELGLSNGEILEIRLGCTYLMGTHD